MEFTKKAIIIEYSNRKINGFYASKFIMAGFYRDGFYDHLSWNRYKKLNVEDTTHEDIFKRFLMVLLNQIKQFNKKVSANVELKDMLVWSFKIDHLLKYYGVKISKRGLKNS